MKYAALILTFLISAQSHAAGVCDDDRFLQDQWESKYKALVKFDNKNVSSNSYLYKFAKTLCFIDNAGLPNLDYFTYFMSVPALFFVNSSTNPEDPSSYAETNFLKRVINIYTPFFKTIPPGKGIHVKGYDQDNYSPNMDYLRASTLIHETRHLELEKRNDPANIHVICTQGRYRGKIGCDREFSRSWDNAGAYSYEVLFLRKLYDYAPGVNKYDLMYWIKQRMENSFNYVSPELKAQYLAP